MIFSRDEAHVIVFTLSDAIQSQQFALWELIEQIFGGWVYLGSPSHEHLAVGAYDLKNVHANALVICNLSPTPTGWGGE